MNTNITQLQSNSDIIID